MTVDLSDVATLDPAEIVELGFTPEVLKKTDYAFNVTKKIKTLYLISLQDIL